MDNRHVTGRTKRIVPKPPPLPYSIRLASLPVQVPSNSPASTTDEQNQSVCIQLKLRLHYIYFLH